MPEQRSFVDSFFGFFEPVHSDGHKFVAIAAVATAIGFLLSSVLGLLLFLVTVFIAYFFRDPERIVPQRAGLVTAAADGKVIQIEEISPPEELKMGPDLRLKISVHLSLFDVHINRAPVSGKILERIETPGLFLNSELDKASEDNERMSLVIETLEGEKLAVVAIAGVISRRIVSFVGEGQRIGIGERFGLIRFGSRVDVYLPHGTTPLVALGQRTIAGETLLADLASKEPMRETRAI